MKILITDTAGELAWHLDEEIAALKEHLPGVTIEAHPYTTPAELKKHIADADGVLTSFVPLSADILAAAPKLQVISVKALGTDTIDTDYAHSCDITVRNVRDYCTTEVADHTMALILALNRQLKTYDQRLQSAPEDMSAPLDYTLTAPPARLAGQTLALFGWGQIARAVARRALAFDLAVIVVSQHLTAAEARRAGVEVVSAADAFARADIISNHQRQTPAIYHYFDASAFSQMARRPLFINTGRAAAVDEDALIAALASGQVSAAGLDVTEPGDLGRPRADLLGRENVIITPHAAFYSAASEQALFTQAIANLVAGLNCH